MQLSDFERRVLFAIIRGDREESALALQLASASVEKRDYTGVGLYTLLAIDPQTPRLESWNRHIEDYPRTHLSHPALSAGAGAILWISEYKMSTLECFTYDGDWPSDESPFSISQ